MKKTLSNLKKIFLKRQSRQTCKISSVHGSPDPLSSLFQCDLPRGAEHDRAEWRRLARPCLKRNAVSLACKAAEQESWESQQEKIWKCNFILYYKSNWKILKPKQKRHCLWEDCNFLGEKGGCKLWSSSCLKKECNGKLNWLGIWTEA